MLTIDKSRRGGAKGVFYCVLTIDSQGGEVPREYFIVCVYRSVKAGRCQGSISLCVLTIDQSRRGGAKGVFHCVC